jgi:hypothetical protein
MPAIAIESPEQYKKAWEVLIQVGGTFHGVGQDNRTLLVTEAQYEALVTAGVVKGKGNGTKDLGRGKKKAHRDGTAEGTVGRSEN